MRAALSATAPSALQQLEQSQLEQLQLRRQLALRQLTFLYVILLVLEGAIRKWGLPPLAGPLLLVRDPIAAAILWLSWRQGYWRGERWLGLWCWLAGLLLITGLLALLWDGVQPISILIFGLRTALLHLPLILLLPRILTTADVLHIGRVFVAISVPIALLMVWQYSSPADAWVNRTTIQGGSLLTAVAGKVRPPGPFSFISGAAEYFALVNAFLLTGFVNQTATPRSLAWGLAATLIAAGVSGSRLLFGYSQLVWVLGVAAILLLRPDRLNSRSLLTIAFASLLGMALLLANPFRSQLEEGQKTTQARFADANSQDGGVLQRAQTMFDIPEHIWATTPPFGHGLGMGTNFAALKIGGRVGFLLQENEWPRMIQESGAFSGSLFILFRIGLAVHVGRQALACLRRGAVLPLALFLAGFHLLIIGPIARPTTLGFAVVMLGLSVTAAYGVLSPPPEPSA